MIEGKGLGGKRICRVNLSLTNETNRKLGRLAVACGVRPTALAAMMVEHCLNDVGVVDRVQTEMNKVEAYKVLPIRDWQDIR